MPSKDKLVVGNKLFMYQITNSLKNKLKKYGDDPRIKGREDEYVKEQLNKVGKDKYYYPGVSEDLKKGILGTEQTFFENPNYQKWLNDPKNIELKNQQNKKFGELYNTQFSNLRPDQQQLSADITKAAQSTIPGLYQKLGHPTSLEKPTEQILMQLINQINQGKGLGHDSLSGFGAFPGLKENLQGLGQGAQQLGQGAYGAGQGAYNAINPYLQAGMQRGAQMAQGGMNQAQSYLSAAQPYAQKAANMGGDALNYIRSSAMNAGSQGMQGIGNLLGLLTGRK